MSFHWNLVLTVFNFGVALTYLYLGMIIPAAIQTGSGVVTLMLYIGQYVYLGCYRRNMTRKLQG